MRQDERSTRIRKLLLLLLIGLSAAKAQEKMVDRAIGSLQAYLNMAGSQTAREFRPLTQRERAGLYVKSLTTPFLLIRNTASAGLDQWKNEPDEWGQGWGAYGKRLANISGQYSVQKTVAYALSAALHEDNRYFGSGKKRFWPRLGYAVSSPFVARHDDGSLHFSVSSIGGIASGAAVARFWLPASQRNLGDTALSFAYTTAGSSGMSIVKEFLPDILRAITGRKGNTSNQQPHPLNSPSSVR